jgi:hypothetical protein
MVTGITQRSSNALNLYTKDASENGTSISYITPYTFMIMRTHVVFDLDNSQEAYNYATSGNVGLGESWEDLHCDIHSPSVFDPNKSLLYFKADTSNLDTRWLQPDLPKGTAIHHIGPSFLMVLDYAFWGKKDILVGREGYGSVVGRDPLVKSPNETITFGDNLRSSTSSNSNSAGLIVDTVYYSHAAISANASLRSASGNTNNTDGYSYYHQDGVIYDARLEGYERMGWSLYLLKKDGNLDLVKQQFYAYDPFSFDFSTLSNVDEYARTSDGYLRARLNWNGYEISGYDKYGDFYGYNYVKYFFIDYQPEKPQLAVKKNFLRSSSLTNSNYKNVELAYSNTTGATSARILRREYEDDELVSSMMFSLDVNAGSLATSVDKSMKTTFQMEISNNWGTVVSNVVTINPSFLTNYRPDIHIATKFDGMYEVILIDQISKENIAVKSAKVVNVLNPSISTQVNNNNTLNISNLPGGVYGVSVVDENNEIYNVKVVK